MAVGKILHKHLSQKGLDMYGGRGSWDCNLDKHGKRVKTNWKSDKTLTDWDYFKGKESNMSDYKSAAWRGTILGIAIGNSGNL